MSVKLQKILAEIGMGSRRGMEQVISAGRVRINSRVAKLGDRANPGDKIYVDNKFVTQVSMDKPACRVLAYNKPDGEICSRNDPDGRPSVFEALPIIPDSRWVSVGRLDINTTGLILFTNDGELANRLMHPSHVIEREYSVRVFGEISPEIIEKLSKGVELSDGMAAFDKISFVGGEGINRWYNVVLHEGRNREVRRIFEAVGLRVSRLIRIRYGNLTLSRSLSRGEWEELSLSEVNYLRHMVDLPDETEAVRQFRNPSKDSPYGKGRKSRSSPLEQRRFREDDDAHESSRRSRRSDEGSEGRKPLPHRPGWRDGDDTERSSWSKRRPSSRGSERSGSRSSESRKYSFDLDENVEKRHSRPERSSFGGKSGSEHSGHWHRPSSGKAPRRPGDRFRGRQDDGHSRRTYRKDGD